MTDMVSVYLGLGSNLGNRQANLDMALKLLSERMRMGKISSIYDTEPLDNVNQPRFLNLACEVQTRLAPEGLLALVKGIEQKMGRYSRTGEPRIIDIDILLYGNTVMESPNLTIPHARMVNRSFVLAPLSEIAPDVIHPITKKSIREMNKAIKEQQGVLKLEGK
jgi:2-amino-4-hydroxy-6-hydroxymethyldihydropteridine diphosphokinase